MILLLVTYCFLYYIFAGIGVALVYHRSLTHNAFKFKKGLEYFWVLVALPAGSPVQWVGTHRAHHKFVDEEEDPHSPITKGFWFAHCGWYIHSKNVFKCLLYAFAGPVRMLIDAFNRPKTNQEFNEYAQNIAQDAFYRKISSGWYYSITVLLHLSISLVVVYLLAEWWGVAALWFTMVAVYNIGDGVNSFGHNTSSEHKHHKAWNSKIWALLTFGDALHGNHHDYPVTAKLSVAKGEFDLGWRIILFFKFLHLAYDVRYLNNGKIETL